MDDCGGKDLHAQAMSGKIVTVSFIDDAGQIHLVKSGLALIPGVDEYELLL